MRASLPSLIAFFASCGLVAAAAFGKDSEPEAPTAPPIDPRVHEQQRYATICKACHPLMSPRTMTSEDWPTYVTTMRRFSKERGFTWSEEDFDAALRYLVRHGR